MQHNCSKAIKQEAINMTNTHESLVGEKTKPNAESQGNPNQTDPGKRQKTTDEMDIQLDPLHNETLEIIMEDATDKPDDPNQISIHQEPNNHIQKMRHQNEKSDSTVVTASLTHKCRQL